jgi:hypothetical protein
MTMESFDVIREPASQLGMVGTAAAALVERLKGTGEYVSEKNLGEIADDLTTLIRRDPIPALLIGVGLGYALGRSRQRRPS